jgi:glycosyltransferase involved in cell wall biosynthesis
VTEKPKGKRKILVLAPSLKSIGGVQNYIRTFVDALNSVIGSDCVRVVSVAEDPKVAADGILALSTSAKIRFLVSTVANALTWSPDLIICAHVGLAPAARIVRKITGTPYWLILYGIEVWGDLPPAKVEALRSAERYITITQFTLDAMAARHNLKHPRASILPPTLPKPPLRSGDENYSLRKEWDRPIVLTVGRIAASERYKGHDAMLDAWPEVLRSVPQAEYWIVGSGDDRPRLESRVRQMGVTGSVHFKGSVSQQELDVCYDRCTVFAMPARTELDARTPRGEGFGIVFLEAMARGKPVIGPRVGAPAEFIRSGEHGLLVDPANPGEIARALIELLQDPARSRSMGEAGRDWVAREFTFDRFCERLRDALQE